RSHDLEKLAFGDYVHDLLAEMIHTYGVGQGGVSLHSDVEEVYLGIDTAIPCGLIINELVSNALKHAFPDGKGGDVRVELRKTQDGKYVLNVCDNGIGLPSLYDYQQSKSLGLKLVADLTKQIDGNLVVENSQGTKFQITFGEIHYKERR
ncbi:MAG: ATP-binding protein, partial [Nitrospirota bacterium]